MYYIYKFFFTIGQTVPVLVGNLRLKSNNL